MIWLIFRGFSSVNACGGTMNEDLGNEDVTQINNLLGASLKAPAEIKLAARQKEDDEDFPLTCFTNSNTVNIADKIKTKQQKSHWVKQNKSVVTSK